MENNPVLFLFAVALLGICLGFGLVIGAFVARSLRRYMESEDMQPYTKRAGRRNLPPEDQPPQAE